MHCHLLACTALCLTISSAHAETAPFQALDVNEDGLITGGEAQSDPQVVKIFRELDINGDGFLNQAEYSAIELSKDS